MKALLSTATGGPETLQLGELPRPSAGKGQIVIDVKACAVNFPDVLIIEDKYQFRPERPFAPGGEVAGLVAEVGEGVTEFKVGDRVIAGCGNGGMSEAVAVSVHNVYHLPEAHDFAEGASLLMTYGTSIHALVDRGHIGEGDTLLVLGASGGVGIAAVELGKAFGARVVAGVSSEEKAGIARAAGADEVVVYGRQPFDKDQSKELANKFKEAVGPNGANLVYDAVGGDYAEPALRSIAWEGRYLVVGFPAGIPRLPLNLTLLKSCDVAGVFWGAFVAREPVRNRANIARLFQLWEQGKIKPRVTESFALADGGKAIAKLGDRTAVGKLVVTL
ncbi:NADPH:quinone reductase-like Zn-dependent oxidoreductase [Sphingopyxis italica]|uniref:NADPH:quinone reductase-like Zn-dependent oxidoreductase n=1 Tax=Sphingopyxis italica TaxID=1129133 RepID=A0A7X6BAK7_9SPHN|nr:NADPH:quinone oxidoreductase family protein [Sphingopyxis italica]NJB90977.1 NADPH:quinone reductase-like Zn-dependent oxidoreductase [Sphingopyxis italica]